MEDSGSDSDPEFSQFLQECIEARNNDFCEDNQSDISVSSVHSSDLSDLSEGDSDDDYDLPVGRQDQEWTRNVCNQHREPFTSFVGPTMPLPLDAEPIEYFLQLFPAHLFDQIAMETTRYAAQKGNDNFHTTADEIKAYLGLLFLMGVVKLPNYRCYWSTREELHQTSISKVMPRKRYEELTSYFHLNDSQSNPARGQPGHDKLHKVRPIIDNAKEQFFSHYSPSRNLSVDEAMVKFKGRCPFLQYIPAKPCKWGIKSWAVTDAETFYLLDLNIYTGKHDDTTSQLPVSTRVVLELVEAYYNKHHHVYFDNYFTSMPLLETLLVNGTYACGTVRLNRKGIPKELQAAKFKQSGEHLKLQKGDIMAVSWCEKKRKVSVLSSANDVGDIQLDRPGKRRQPRQSYPKPIAIQDYSNNYNGVDKSDQLRSYYGIANKAKKWWKYIFWFICDVTMVNSFILYTHAPGGPRRNPMSHLEFHLDVAKGLIGQFTSRKRQLILARSPPTIKRPADHEPSKVKTKRGKRNCVYCSRLGITTSSGNHIQTSWECTTCAVALCKDKGCFARFHNYVN
ncbi:piggyBac transposable element-derived protein 4-like [Lingula anatina]|uniref:PiggyBac transposable element-derived protein 4-like n=1 Tax=Lingula anatina TaxID=7574 RepID=A0A1S3JAC3_LINAN|nr:piggyBac transposable element-derived protein 4-like [Lingula anatina]|eukprot:XP_013407355.1 piggyBac transposable element-derived protein 4-like [Lingula anatina]